MHNRDLVFIIVVTLIIALILFAVLWALSDFLRAIG
jgi:hypothetical protein